VHITRRHYTRAQINQEWLTNRANIQKLAPIDFWVGDIPIGASISHTGKKLGKIHYDQTLTYQIVFGLTVLKCQEFFQLSGCSTTRGHRFKLMKQQCRGYRRHFFTNRVINIWNFFPKDVVNFSTLCSFTSSLNSVDFSRFLMFTLIV